MPTVRLAARFANLHIIMVDEIVSDVIMGMTIPQEVWLPVLVHKSL